MRQLKKEMCYFSANNLYQKMDLRECGLDDLLKRYVNYNQQIPRGLTQAYVSVISGKDSLTPHIIES